MCRRPTQEVELDGLTFPGGPVADWASRRQIARLEQAWRPRRRGAGFHWQHPQVGGVSHGAMIGPIAHRSAPGANAVPQW